MEVQAGGRHDAHRLNDAAEFDAQAAGYRIHRLSAELAWQSGGWLKVSPGQAPAGWALRYPEIVDARSFSVGAGDRRHCRAADSRCTAQALRALRRAGLTEAPTRVSRQLQALTTTSA